MDTTFRNDFMKLLANNKNVVAEPKKFTDNFVQRVNDLVNKKESIKAQAVLYPNITNEQQRLLAENNTKEYQQNDLRVKSLITSIYQALQGLGSKYPEISSKIDSNFEQTMKDINRLESKVKNANFDIIARQKEEKRREEDKEYRLVLEKLR